VPDVNARDAAYAAAARRRLGNGTARALRIASGLSQGDVGSVIGVCDAAVSHYEARRRAPRGRVGVRYGRLLERLAVEHEAEVAS
jgi:predicted transcriptional regulator